MSSDGGRQVWLRQLQDGGVAVALYNSADVAQRVGTTVSALGLSTAGQWVARNVFDQKSIGPVEAPGELQFQVPAHGVVMLRLTPQDYYAD